MKPKMKILIAWDGSESADDALDDLVRAGLPREAEAIMVSVAEMVLPPPMPSGYRSLLSGFTEPYPNALKEKHAQVLAAGLRLREHFPAWDVRTETVVGSPASVVLAKGEEWQPHLIVAGSHGHSKLGRFILGSVSQRIVTDAHCSVRIGRRRIENATEPVRLVIGIDGSPEAGAAVQAVAEREWPAGSEVRVIAVRDQVVSGVLDYVSQHDKSGWEWLHDTIETAEAKLREAGLEVSSGIRDGDPRQMLPNEAVHWGADAIFVGARGLSRLERFRLGSVSAAVVARAACSVEVIRRTTY